MMTSNDDKIGALQQKVNAITDTMQDSIFLIQHREESLEHLSTKAERVQEKSAVFYREVRRRRRWYIRLYHFIQRHVLII